MKNSRRLHALDIARGIAIVQMVAYHFLYDLGHFGWIRIDTYGGAGWIAWRGAIVSQFLLVMGYGLCAFAGQGADREFWRRWAQILACALLVSAATALTFGPRWIWFGVLHFAVVAQLLVRAARGTFARLPAPAIAGAAIALLAAGNLVQVPAFAADSLSWIGFSPGKPATEDFVPVLPWLGVVLAGFALARMRTGSAAIGESWMRARAGRILAAAGRWPLTIYMAHQPVLFGTLWLLSPSATSG
jgi:uncharacterized membrane protein